MIEICLLIIMFIAFTISFGLAFFYAEQFQFCRYHWKNNFKFITKHGIEVQLTPRSCYLTPATVEAWTVALVDFWHKTMTKREDQGIWDKASIYASIYGSKMIIFDEDILIENQRRGYGWAWVLEKKHHIVSVPPKSFWWTKKAFILYLFKHELSHTIVARANKTYLNEDASHNLFKEVGLDP